MTSDQIVREFQDSLAKAESRHDQMLLAGIEKASEVYNRPSRRSPDYARAMGHILRAIQEAAE